ncbi:gamma-glutamylcyclotransferase [bacterium]|nr:gamma-glutamylcyclotransferase [bacterium]
MRVWVFLYGSYINPKVLAEVNLSLRNVQVASLSGYALTITPRANLVEEDGASVYGVVATATHEELDRLYRHAQEVLGQLYRPQAVLVRSQDGQFRPALAYLCADLSGELPDGDYVRSILEPAREYGFPTWYLRHVESFAPPGFC